jgi:hypothetical protein
MRVFPRRSLLASVAAGSCLAASVVAGGYAASGAMPFSSWPGSVFSSAGAAEVALAPATRAAAPVLTLPAPTSAPEAPKTEVIPLEDAASSDESAPAASTTPRRTATTERTTRKRAPNTDDVPDTSPTTAPTTKTTTETPAATAASPAAEAGPTQPAATVQQPATRKVKLGSVSSTFSNAHDSSSGQPELRVQMAVADAAEATGTRTVALSLKLAPTDVASLLRSAAAINSSKIALETQVDVVDATVTSAGTPTCADGQCLRVQMMFAPDTRVNPADDPEVQLLDDGDAISNRVKVVVKIDADDLGTKPTAPATEPAPEAGTPSVLSLPLPAAADPSAPSAPTTDTATVALPDGGAAPGTPQAPQVQVQAQLEVVDTPPAPETPAPEVPAATDTTTAASAAPAPAAETPAPAATTPAETPAPAAGKDCD